MNEIQKLKEKIKDSQIKLNNYLFQLGFAFAVMILNSYNVYYSLYPGINGICLGIIIMSFSFTFQTYLFEKQALYYYKKLKNLLEENKVT